MIWNSWWCHFRQTKVYDCVTWFTLDLHLIFDSREIEDLICCFHFHFCYISLSLSYFLSYFLLKIWKNPHRLHFSDEVNYFLWWQINKWNFKSWLEVMLNDSSFEKYGWSGIEKYPQIRHLEPWGVRPFARKEKEKKPDGTSSGVLFIDRWESMKERGREKKERKRRKESERERENMSDTLTFQA